MPEISARNKKARELRDALAATGLSVRAVARKLADLDDRNPATVLKRLQRYSAPEPTRANALDEPDDDLIKTVSKIKSDRPQDVARRLREAHNAGYVSLSLAKQAAVTIESLLAKK